MAASEGSHCFSSVSSSLALPAGEHFFREKPCPSTGHQNDGCIKPGGPRHSHKETCNFPGVGIATLYNVANILVVLDPLFLSLFRRKPPLKTEISHFLGALVKFAQFLLGIGFVADGFQGNLIDLIRVADEALNVTREAFAHTVPKLVGSGN